MPDTYFVTVILARSKSDDAGVLDDAGVEMNIHNLVQQVRTELQGAYDDGHIAGQFEITAVIDGDDIHSGQNLI